MTQIFISYSRKDLTFIERLAADLKNSGFDVWYDVSSLDGGVRWNRVIEQAIKDSQYAIVVLSPDSVASEYVEDEISFARKLKKKIIPLYYRPCDLGMLYINLNYIDVQDKKYGGNFDKILGALNASNLKKAVEPAPKKEQPIEEKRSAQVATPKIVTPQNKITLSNGMDFVRVPAGKFLMGSNNGEDREKPQHTVDIPYDYWMARFPTTNENYSVYAKAKGIKHPVDGWEKKKDHPVVYISWSDSTAYCEWLNNLLKDELPAGLVLRLPTEAEWEKSSRGTDGREYPWGNTFDKNNCNTEENKRKDTTPVGSYSPRGDSPYGCADMAGNVWEWCHSVYKPYPYTASDGREDKHASGYRNIRGGSYYWDKSAARCAFRYYGNDGFRLSNYGFRVVASPVLS